MCMVQRTEKKMPLVAELIKSKIFHRRREENSIEWIRVMPDILTSLFHIIFFLR